MLDNSSMRHLYLHFFKIDVTCVILSKSGQIYWLRHLLKIMLNEYATFGMIYLMTFIGIVGRRIKIFLRLKANGKVV